jgi:hypothetical protein
MGEYGAESSGGKNVLCLETKLKQWVAKDKFFFQHVTLPVMMLVLLSCSNFTGVQADG